MKITIDSGTRPKYVIVENISTEAIKGMIRHNPEALINKIESMEAALRPPNVSKNDIGNNDPYTCAAAGMVAAVSACS